MKTLQTYLIEAVKPPRLSAKNKHLWKDGLVDEDRVIEWLKDNCRVEGSVDIVDGKINVKGGVEVGDHIEESPYPFGEVTRNFDCSECKNLKFLKNSPQMVGGYFDCSFCNNLTSLEGAPEEVGGDFYCYRCGKEFTEEDVVKLCRVKGYIWI